MGYRQELAHDLLMRGYRVVIGDLDLETTEATAKELGVGAIAVQLDVTDTAGMAASIDRIESEIGGAARS
ncbi:NADP-dependent 3-hydroxy acid dehydrogenase YdfG [Microbacterium halimionae]|uniref:NADP-dependent 3-hydroxy acid dehydrogenase YdfG n=1 Tax=Microbacterium halimionae TaxID=1526413 RepID=A0A7W3PKZ2_9MICO|nr:hypothetical protein [Microbacterium halimionae]MBA8815367.1 NADP-dependent 3-hydroxy acid dehydrogenase YdfG [Microbacterium halimionae]NII95414.1 NADP-dependent 3-hydroxy acid dehydrogenase YdfG [Microbacterium halimionae]